MNNQLRTGGSESLKNGSFRNVNEKNDFCREENYNHLVKVGDNSKTLRYRILREESRADENLPPIKAKIIS